MPDGEIKELFAANISYVYVVKDHDGHYLRTEGSGKIDDQIMWPWGHSLDTKVAEKRKELEQG